MSEKPSKPVLLIVQLAAVAFTTRAGLFIPPILGAVAAEFSDFGERVDIALFSTIAQIAPIFLVAMLLSELFMVRRFMEEKKQDAGPRDTRLFNELVVNRQVALLLAVEVPALLALGLGHGTTFLTVWTLLAVLALTFAFRKNQAQHFSVSTRDLTQGVD